MLAKLDKSVLAPDHEWHAKLKDQKLATLYDIKHKTIECTSLVAVRPYPPFLNAHMQNLP
jgi:hypothetical protein